MKIAFKVDQDDTCNKGVCVCVYVYKSVYVRTKVCMHICIYVYE